MKTYLTVAFSLVASCFWPVPAPAGDDDSWTSSDKYLHFGVSFALDTGGYLAARHALDWPKNRSLAAAAGFALLAGAGKEFTDEKFDEKDVAWNAAGVGLSSLLWFLVDRDKQPVKIVASPGGVMCVYAKTF